MIFAKIRTIFSKGKKIPMPSECMGFPIDGDPSESEEDLLKKMMDAQETQDDYAAFQYAKYLSDHGNTIAQYHLGRMYLHGFGVLVDNSAAEMCLSKITELQCKAAKSGNKYAPFCLGEMYRIGDVVNENISEAIKWYRKAVEMGNGYAAECLGNLYYGDYFYNCSFENDKDEASKWYCKAREQFQIDAEQGDGRASCKLGDMYMSCDGLGKNIEDAKKWYRKAIEFGYAHAAYQFGNCTNNMSERIKQYHRAVELGDHHAAYVLAVMYRDGFNGVDKNINEEIKWQHKAAELGNGDAAKELGDIYLGDNCVKKDIDKVIMWYCKATELGNGDAAEYLGNMCWGNDEVEKNIEKVLRWYCRAVELRNGHAAKALGDMYQEGDGVEKDIDMAIKWYYKADEQGCDGAASTLEKQLY